MKKLILFIVAVLVCVACESPGIRTVETAKHPNAQVVVEVVVEFDGIRLYRVKGVGQTVFVVAHMNDLKTASGELKTSWEVCDDDSCTPYGVQTIAKR